MCVYCARRKSSVMILVFLWTTTTSRDEQSRYVIIVVQLQCNECNAMMLSVYDDGMTADVPRLHNSVLSR